MGAEAIRQLTHPAGRLAGSYLLRDGEGSMEANAVEKKPLATGKTEAQKLDSLGPVRLLRRWGGSDIGATVMVSRPPVWCSMV